MPPPVSSHWLVVVLKRVVWDVAGLGWVGLGCVVLTGSGNGSLLVGG